MKRRSNLNETAAVAGAFGLGLFLALACSFRLALILAALLLIWHGASILRR